MARAAARCLGPADAGWRRALLPGYVVLVIAYTLVPIAVMVLYGFNQAPSGPADLRLAGLHARLVPATCSRSRT